MQSVTLVKFCSSLLLGEGFATSHSSAQVTLKLRGLCDKSDRPRFRVMS